MCGILGAYSRDGALPDTERFTRALERLRIREPEDSGCWSDHHVALGHRRLSIVDVSPAGHHPRESADGRYVITFNGEIYNHRELRQRLGLGIAWRGGSDTEILLESYWAWGAACLQQLIGMLAFAIWDCRQRALFLAPDSLGVNPLHYTWQNDRLCFASRAAQAALYSDQKKCHERRSVHVRCIRGALVAYPERVRQALAWNV
jgi:asparagine synthase (glutamine-hydrolysing)